MRKELRKLHQKRLRFRATIVCFGTKPTGFYGKLAVTVLLEKVELVENNKKVTDHIWLNVGKKLLEADLKPGNILEFDARVGYYIKNGGFYSDYNLQYPTNITKVIKAPKQTSQLLAIHSK